MFQSTYTTVISNIQKSLEKGSAWINDALIDHAISISKYNPLSRSSYIKLSKELDHLRKGLIDIQNIDDNECFKWSTVRYLNPANHRPVRITKADKDFAKKNDFKGIKCPVKIKDINKIEKNNSTGISVFGCESKEIHPIYISKQCCEEKHVDLLLVGEVGKRHYVLIKDFSTFMFDHLLNCG